jgi:hypothetical protein
MPKKSGATYQEVIVTYGENNSVGKEMLRRKLATLRRCTNCGQLFEPAVADQWECIECACLTDEEKELYCTIQGVPDYTKIK